jgi:hypothetical protein
MKRVLPIALALAGVIGLAALLGVVRRWDPASNVPGSGTGRMAMVAHDAVMVARRTGRVDWRLQVSKVVLRRAEGADATDFVGADFTNVREGALYDARGPVATFRAGGAEYERLTGRLDVRGGLMLRSTDGDAFTSERCIWTERDEFARFPEGARATILGDTVSAPHMIYSTRTRLVQCPDGAEGTFRGRRIVARAMEWDSAGRTVRCTGPIRGRSDGLSFTADYAELDLKLRTIRVNKGTLDLRIESREGATTL